MKKLVLGIGLAVSLLFGIDKSPKINNFSILQSVDVYEKVDNFDVATYTLTDLENLASSLKTFEKRLNDFVSNLDFHKYTPEQLDSLLANTNSRDGSAVALADKVLDLVSKLEDKFPNILDGADLTDDKYIRTLEDLLSTTLRLSDDIGIMADRIGEMADRIVYTEELIGEMADRIVHTEHLIVYDSEVIANSSLHIADLLSLKVPDRN